jgi:hypothetical protein
MRLDLVGINAVRHAERTLEGAIAAFGEMIVLLFFRKTWPLQGRIDIVAF